MTAWRWNVPDMLSQEQEAELTGKASGGDAAAAAKLACANIRLVLSMAISMSRGGDVDDMVGEGMIGLWIAAIRYDPSYGVKFCTYATWWIKSLMVYSVKKRRRMMAQFPSTYLFRKELARMYTMTGASSNDESVQQAVCGRMEISREKFRELQIASSMLELRLEAPLFAGSGLTFADLTPADLPAPEEECMERERSSRAKREIELAMKALSEREAFVIRSIMREETMDQIGKKLGVSKQRVKQINDRAFRKMKARILSSRSGFHDLLS